MTKSLKGLSSRNFTTTTNLDDGTVGRLAFLAADSAAPATADFSLGDSGSISEGIIQLDVEGELTVLDCLEPKDLWLQYLETHGGSLTADAQIFDLSEISDEGPLAVVVGGSVSAVIDTDTDTDDITVFLVAGQIYSVSLRGTGATPLNDALLQVFNPAAAGGTLASTDDDGGNDRNSFLTFTAATTGQYVIRAGAFDNPGQTDAGGYTVDVRVQGADAVGGTNATSVPLGFGTTFGFRESGAAAAGTVPEFGTQLDGDVDRYSFQLEAGHFYTFKLAGGWDGGAGGTNALNTVLILRDSNGTLITFNDNIGSDLSSGLGFFAQTSGTYYVDTAARPNTVGGYALEFLEIDLSTQDPLDSINWVSAANVDFVENDATPDDGIPTAYVYFAVAGENFGELQRPQDGGGPLPSYGWNDREKAQLMLALEEFEHILGVNYEVTTDSSQATFRVITTTSTQFGAFFYPQDPAFGTQQGIGAFNVNNAGWDKPGQSTQDIPGDQVGLEQGGFNFATILHEFGHAHGLAHPHDNGGGSDIMLGVVGQSGPGTFGVFNLNQGVYTVMSYNDAWPLGPDGASPLTIAGIDNGWSGTLSAFDIAMLQIRYGVHDYNTGDNVYALTDVIDDAFYQCIWDTGGTDVISYGGTLNASIDLNTATLDYTPTGGGIVSYLDAPATPDPLATLRGGYTIANGVVIENATSGEGNDQLIGNDVANVLTSNGGTDNLMGRGGDDTIDGGAGADTAYFDGDRGDYTIEAVISGGQITGITVKDNNAANGDEGTDTLNGIESAHFNDVSVSLAGAVAVFDENDNLISVHTTIQAAIDASTTLDGYTVFVGSGSYAENVVVNKDLTIQGANEGVAGTDGARIAETVIDGSVTVPVNGVTIDGVRIIGTSPLSTFDVGVYVTGNDFSLVNSVLDGPDGSFGDTVAVLVDGVTGLDIGNNLLTGYLRGAYLFTGTTTGEIYDNLFLGDGPPHSESGMGNGIVSNTSLVLIHGNEFNGIWAGVVNVGPFGPGTTVDVQTYVFDNTFVDNLGVRVVQIYPTTDTQNLLGTSENDTFNGDIAGLASGTAVSFDGRGGNDDIYGWDAGDDLSGGAGLDRIFANDGDDTLNGGADNDLLDGEGGIDTAVFAGNPLLYTDTAIGWLIASSDGNDFVQNVEIVEAGNGQRNLLVGSTGFGAIQTAFDNAEAGDNVRLASGVYSGTWNYDDANLTVTAQAGARINGTFTPSGTQGITVVGGALNDDITTGAGSDLLIGNGGADRTAGGAGDDRYYVDNAGDVVVEAVGGGFDRVLSSVSYALAAGAEVELLAASSSSATTALNFTGNAFANTIYGNAGVNVLVDGGGADVLNGLAGNDRYYVSSAAATVIETVGGGSDAVFASVSYTLAPSSQVEILSAVSASATTAINLTGNGFANTLYGNAGDNVLDGKLGNDLLIGFGGADTFAFTTALGANNVDAVRFEAGDKIALDDAVFTGLGLGALDPNAFVTGTAAQDANDRIIYNQATGQLYFDADGNGAGAAILFATLQGAPVIHASDFTVI